MTLTHAELIDIVVALDNEACRPGCENPERVRSLKWKVFALSVSAAKVQDEPKAEHDCANGGREDWCDDCNPYLQ